MDGFLTIHELSTQFNVSAKAIRSRLHKLIAAGKLLEHADFIRDKYVDPTHFEWRVNPVTFMRASGLTLSPVIQRPHPVPSATLPVAPIEELGGPTDNQEVARGNKTDNQRATTASHGQPVGGKAAAQAEAQGQEPSAHPSLWREIVDFLKHQIGIKDAQIKDLTEQKKAADELSRSLIGQVVRLNTRIDELLSLPPAPAPKEQKFIKVDEPRDATVNHATDVGATDGEPKTDASVTQGSRGATDAVAQEK